MADATPPQPDASTATSGGAKTPLVFNLRKLARKVYRLIVQPRVVRQDRIVVVDDAERCTNPVFLIGLHRSGTTLVRQIVDSHPSIACPPESYFLLHLAKAYEDENYAIGLGYMGFDPDAVRTQLARYAGFHYEAYRKSKDKPRWADKTPDYVQCLPFLQTLFGDETKFVLIYRHPFDIVNSLLSKKWRIAEHHDDPFENYLAYAADGLAKMRSFEAEHPDRCYALRYERLMQDPEPVLREAFEFLGEPWDPCVLRFNDKQHDMGVGDSEAQVFRTFRPSVNNWAHWTEAMRQRGRAVLGEHLDALGYPSAPESAPEAAGSAS
ncbi:MAG: sulfotransferase [Planctomycetota bacterium]